MARAASDRIRQLRDLSGLLRSPLGSYLVFGLAVCFLWAFARTVHGRGDEGLLLYPAERILRGQIPYKDFFTELAPGVFYIQALWFRVFGISLLSARLPMLLVMAGIAVEIFHLSRRWMRGWVAALPVLIYVVTAFTRWMVVSHHWYSVFFALGALIFALRFLDSRRSGILFWAGICTSLSGICMQNKGAFVFLALATALFVDSIYALRRGSEISWKGIGFFFLGTSLPALVALDYYRRHDALPELVYSTFTYLWHRYLPYDYQPLLFLPATLVHQVRDLFADFTLLRFGKTFSSILWSMLIPIAAFAFAWSRFRRAQVSQTRRVVGIAYLLVGIGLLLSEMHRFDFIHMLFGSPVLLILAVAWLYRLRRCELAGFRVASGVLVCAAAMYAVNGGSLILRENRRNTEVRARRGTFYQTPDRAWRYQSIIRSIESRVEQGSHTLCYPYSSMLYFLTATNNPTRFDYLLPGQTTPEQFEEVRRFLLTEEAPSYVFSYWRERREALPELYPVVPQEILLEHPLEQFLESSQAPFRVVEEGARFVIFQRNVSAQARVPAPIGR